MPTFLFTVNEPAIMSGSGTHMYSANSMAFKYNVLRVQNKTIPLLVLPSSVIQKRETNFYVSLKMANFFFD